MNYKLSIYLLVLALWAPFSAAHAQGTAFSYQGRLLQDGLPANGPYDFVFAVFDATDAGVQAGQDFPVNNSPVVNGQFTVTLDFGPGVFTSRNLWLEISVRSAGNGEFTKMVPRVPLLPTPYAIFAETAGTVADGALTAGQLNTGGIAPTPGQFLSYNENKLFWSDPPVAAGNIWSRNGADTYFNSGSVGIGTSTPTAGIKLEVNGGLLLTPGGSGGKIQFGTPSTETGMTIIGVNRADIRFDGQTLKLLANAGTTPPSVATGIVISTNGNVGVGMFPSPGTRLDVNGPSILRPGGSGGTIQFGTPSGETGMAIIGANRADVRFDGSSLKLLAGFGPGAMPPENGIAITTAGNVGIGTAVFDPKIKLEVKSDNGYAVVGRSGFEGIHGESTSTAAAAVAGFNLSSGPGIYGKSATGVAVYADGNAVQPPDKGGFVKAMVYVDAKGTISRCYNGLTGASGSACNFSIDNLGGNLYGIDFGFRVDDRFVSVTPGQAEEDHTTYVVYKGSASASVVYGYQPTFIGQSLPNSVFVQIDLPVNFGSIVSAGFTVIVY